jgi:hypothetical protein
MMVTGLYRTDGSVVFADPAKLQPYLDAINARVPSFYLLGKRGHAVEGIMKARADVRAEKIRVRWAKPTVGHWMAMANRLFRSLMESRGQIY